MMSTIFVLRTSPQFSLNVIPKTATLAPFTYAQIIYAGIIGWLAFGQAPDALGYLGVVIIIGSAVLVAVLKTLGRNKVGY